VIVRAWSARATAEGAPAYAAHLQDHVLPSTRQVDGYLGAQLLQRDGPDGVELLVLTFWRSLDAIRQFAGDDLESAVVADEAAAVLTSFENHVRHYELVVEDRV
jgi:heme-degrading monooxygenase HmoA